MHTSQVLDMSTDMVGAAYAPDPPPLRLVEAMPHVLHLAWGEPDDLGGGEIYRYELQMSAFETVYLPQEVGGKPSFHEGFRTWAAARRRVETSWECHASGNTLAATL